MKHTTILILTTRCNMNITCHIDMLTISQPVTLLDDFSVRVDKEVISFDYLILLNKNLIINLEAVPFCTDPDTIITNFYQQSSIEHIYFVNEQDVKCDTKIELALNHICYGE